MRGAHHRWGVSLWQQAVTVARVTAASVIVAISQVPLAEAADPVLEQIQLESDAKGTAIRIELNTPVRLISHTPQRNGDLLHLQVQPILLTGDASLRDVDRIGVNRSTLTDRSRIGVLGRQTLIWSPTVAVPLVEVTYEGTGLQFVEPPSPPAIPGRPQLDVVRRPAILVGSAEVLLRFNRNVFYEVQREADPRFLRIVVLGGAAGEVTLPPTEEIPAEGAPGSDGSDVPRTEGEPGAAVEPPAGEGATSSASSAAAVDTAGEYVVNLASSAKPFDDAAIRNTQVDPGRRVYVSTFDKDGTTWYRLRVGFFANAAEAQAARDGLRSAFPDAWVAKTTEAERTASGSGAVEAPATPTAEAQENGSPTPSSGEAMPATGTGGDRGSIEQARQALIDKDYDTAIGLLTRELEDPNTRYRLEALELSGIARERKGQLALAKADYDRYLELNPNGDDAARIKQRLDGLVTQDENLREKLRLSKQEKIGGGEGQAPAGPETEIFGGISQIYRRENQFIEDVGTDPVQSGLQNDLDLNVRRRGEKADLQARFSGGYLYDFLHNGPMPETRISTLFFDAQDKERKYQARIGRQSSTTGGVLGRFDGGLLGAQLTDWARLNFVSGCPVESSINRAIHCEKAFYGVNADIGTFWDALSFNLFGIEQQFDSQIDRRSVGAEMRFFKPNYSLFSLVDYDVSYGELNTFLMLGNYIFENQATVNFIYDHRTSPILTTGNALQGQLVDSLSALDEFYTDDQIRNLAEERTAISDALTLGGSYPLNEQFLINGDVTLTSITGTDGSIGLNGAPDVAPTSRTGVEKIYGLQLIGSNLFKSGDTSIAGVRFSDLEDSDTTSFLFNLRYPVTDLLRVSPLLQFSHTDSDTDTQDWTVQPVFQLNYRLRERMQVEFETGAEWSLLGNPGADYTEFHDYYASLGYRYDF